MLSRVASVGRFHPSWMKFTSSFHSSAKSFYPLTEENSNPLLKKVHYAVRGEIVIRAGEYEKQLQVKSSCFIFFFFLNFFIYYIYTLL